MSQFIIMLLIINSLIFTQMNHPMSMGLILLLQTLLTCLFTGMATKSFWFSYILFLIFIGGMLILFIYMASLASNEKFKFSKNNLITIFMLSMLMTPLMFSDTFILSTNSFNYDSMNENNLLTLIKETYLSVSKMYDLPNNMIIIFLINYLLLNLIIIVKITNLYQGPLRPKN